MRSGVDIVHIQNNADIAVTQNRASGNAVILDMELLQIGRQRLDHDLVLAEQAVYQQAERMFSGIKQDGRDRKEH